MILVQPCQRSRRSCRRETAHGAGRGALSQCTRWSLRKDVKKVFQIPFLPRRRIGRYHTESWQRRSASTRTYARAMLETRPCSIPLCQTTRLADGIRRRLRGSDSFIEIVGEIPERSSAETIATPSARS
jgi:hypothetical protein